jgi:disease resistance protein RPM1
LNRLQLVSTGLSIEDLSALQRLRSLEYLKLVEDDPAGFLGSNFIVQRDGFQSLKRLCLQAPKLPNLQFHDGAMTSLISLHLISPESSLVDVTRQTMAAISHAANINEVVLHYSATKATQDYWKSVVQEHPNRPCVKKEPEPMANASA